jgi:uncharacterized repeat protein (TIGR04076 family)
MDQHDAASAETVTLHDIKVTVDRIEGRSVCGLSVGDSFEVVDSSRVQIPAGTHFCMYAMAAVLPLIPALQRPLAAGDWMTPGIEVACPDAAERLIMRIERTGTTQLRRDALA